MYNCNYRRSCPRFSARPHESRGVATKKTLVKVFSSSTINTFAYFFQADVLMAQFARPQMCSAEFACESNFEQFAAVRGSCRSNDTLHRVNKILMSHADTTPIFNPFFFQFMNTIYGQLYQTHQNLYNKQHGV